MWYKNTTKIRCGVKITVKWSFRKPITFFKTFSFETWQQGKWSLAYYIFEEKNVSEPLFRYDVKIQLKLRETKIVVKPSFPKAVTFFVFIFGLKADNKVNDRLHLTFSKNKMCNAQATISSL